MPGGQKRLEGLRGQRVKEARRDLEAKGDWGLKEAKGQRGITYMQTGI